MKSKLWRFVSVLTVTLSTLAFADAEKVVEWKLDASSGTVAEDSTVNNNDGTLMGNPQWTAGLKNNCLELDGDGDWVADLSASNLPYYRTDPWSINMCVYVDNIPNDFSIIGGFGNQDGFWGEARYIASSGNIQFWGQGIDVTSDWPLDVGKWQMLTVTFSGEDSEGAYGLLTIYKNAREIKSGWVSFFEHDCMSHIKLAPDIYAAEWDVQFAGKIDEFTIWDDALTAEQVEQLRFDIGLLFNQAIWPSPRDGAPTKTGYRAIDPSVVLSWSAPDVNDPTYNVYFGTDPNNLVLESEGQSETSYDPYGSTDLNEGTVYYWRVDVKDPNQGNPVIHTGDIWSFTTWESSAVKVLEWKMDADSGTVAEDSTSNGNDGTLVGDPQWVEGLVGNCLEFDGDGDSVEILDANNLPISRTDAWSINMYLHTWQGQKGNVIGGFGKAVDANWGEARYLMHSGDWRFQFWGESIDVYANAILDLEEWQMFTITYEGSDANDWGELRVYKNGVEKGYDWVNFWEHDALPQAYLSPGVWTNYYSGKLDEFTIWDGALTPTQINELAEALPPLGDLDGDGNVDFIDLAILSGNWMKSQ